MNYHIQRLHERTRLYERKRNRRELWEAVTHPWTLFKLYVIVLTAMLVLLEGVS
jgi:hypothetical protein